MCISDLPGVSTNRAPCTTSAGASGAARGRKVDDGGACEFDGRFGLAGSGREAAATGATAFAAAAAGSGVWGVGVEDAEFAACTFQDPEFALKLLVSGAGCSLSAEGWDWSEGFCAPLLCPAENISVWESGIAVFVISGCGGRLVPAIVTVAGSAFANARLGVTCCALTAAAVFMAGGEIADCILEIAPVVAADLLVAGCGSLPTCAFAGDPGSDIRNEFNKAGARFRDTAGEAGRACVCASPG